MHLLSKLTIKNLKLNKKRTIVTIIGITLSVALITAVACIYVSGIQTLINFETTENGNFHVAYYDVPASDLSVFKNNKKIENVNITKNIGYAKIASKNEYKPYAYVKAFSKDSLENLSVKLVSGRLPENSEEIVIPTHLKTNGRLELKIGETITLNIGTRIGSDGVKLKQSNPFQVSGESSDIIDPITGEIRTVTFDNGEQIIDTTSKTYKIVGIIERPATNIESYIAPGYTFITYLNEEEKAEYYDIYTRYTKDGTKNAYRLTANILGVDPDIFEKIKKGTDTSAETFEKYTVETQKQKYQININDYLIDLETNPIANSSLVGLGVVACLVIVIIVITSVFCIKNSFDISITEKTKQYGMLRSVGATKKQIRKNIFFEATILGLIGIPLGILCGFLATYILILVCNVYFKNISQGQLELKFVFSFVSVIIVVILGIITMYFSAFRSAKRASKVSPIDSIRNSADIKINTKKLKSPKIIKKVFGIGGEISYKNLKRNKKRYKTIVISIVISVSAFIALASFMNIMLKSVETEINLTDYNLSLTTSDISDKNFETYLGTTKLDNIEDFVVLRKTTFMFENVKYNPEYLEWTGMHFEEDDTVKDMLTVYALGKEQYKKYISSLGLNYDEVKDKAILYDYFENLPQYRTEKTEKNERKTLRVLDYKKGDKISGKLDSGNDYTFEICDVAYTQPFGLKKSDNVKQLFVSDELFDSIAKTNSLKILFDSNNATKLQDDIDNYLTEDEEYSLNNTEENVKARENLITLVGIFLYGFIIVITLIGITNIFNTITTNMELRKPEFAMLKSVGMTKKEFTRMIRLESLFMGLKSLLFGIPIGIVLSILIYSFLGRNEGLPYHFPLGPVLITIIAVFLLISVIMKYSMSKINKQNTIETIRNENI